MRLSNSERPLLVVECCLLPAMSSESEGETSSLGLKTAVEGPFAVSDETD